MTKDDLISRCELFNRLATIPAPAEANEFKAKIYEVIQGMETADRPQGEWKRRLVDNGFNADWICSECGYRVKTDFVSFNYCPNCGARMKGADDE